MVSRNFTTTYSYGSKATAGCTSFQMNKVSEVFIVEIKWKNFVFLKVGEYW